MIDMHTHILPGVDDGAKDIEMSKALLEQEKTNGVNKVIFTPHQNKDNLNKEALEHAYQSFLNSISLDGIEIMLGSEIYYYEGLKKDLKEGKLLTINDSKYLLIEFSTRIETDIVSILYDLKVLGYRPILAHIERYDYLTLEDYQAIKRNGALIQVNAGAFEKKDYKKRLKYLLKNQLVDFIASDCHHPDRRGVDFTLAKKIISKKYKAQYEKLFGDYRFE